MTHLATSRVLEDLIIELRKNGLQIPQNVLNDLKSARVMMKIEDVDRKNLGETSPKIDEYLGTVEAYLVTEAQKRLSSESVDEWLHRLEAANFDTCLKEEKEESRFIPGLPRDQKWVRVMPIASLSREKLEEMAEATNLVCRPESDGHLIVYGKDENIREFVKKMTVQAGKQG